MPMTKAYIDREMDRIVDELKIARAEMINEQNLAHDHIRKALRLLQGLYDHWEPLKYDY